MRSAERRYIATDPTPDRRLFSAARTGRCRHPRGRGVCQQPRCRRCNRVARRQSGRCVPSRRSARWAGAARSNLRHSPVSGQARASVGPRGHLRSVGTKCQCAWPIGKPGSENIVNSSSAFSTVESGLVGVRTTSAWRNGKYRTVVASCLLAGAILGLPLAAVALSG